MWCVCGQGAGRRNGPHLIHDDRELQLSENGHSLSLPGINTLFVMPRNDDEGD